MTYSGLYFKCIFFISMFLIGAVVSDLIEKTNASENTEPQVQLLAPGYGELNFEAPKAGSYSLPALGTAKDAKVLNVDRATVKLHEVFKNKYTLLSFMYTRCNDVNGCPLTHLVFNRIRNEASKDNVLNKHLQLVSMSFDPEFDTPSVLKRLSSGGHEGHEGHELKANIPWTYLTTESVGVLQPILDDYNQAVLEDDGEGSGRFSHIMRVYLIDKKLNIRNIYSISFLHPDIIINDVKTLMIEDGLVIRNNSQETVKILKVKDSIRLGPGDDKHGYDSDSYETDSLSLVTRRGEESNLIRVIDNPPLGLPKIPAPKENPVTVEKIKLGKKLFFDRRLSLNNTISCGMCHIPEQGFTNNEIQKSIGFEGRSGRRNAPTIINSAYQRRIFHDARESSLENQIWHPLLARNEMAMTSIGQVIERLEVIPDYKELFEKAFDSGINMMTIGQALASYERVLVSGDSPFDKWKYGKVNSAISDNAVLGYKLFVGKAGCSACHLVGEEFALFMDNQLHNTGLGWDVAMRKTASSKKVLVAPGKYIEIKETTRKMVANAEIGDLGYYEVTQNPSDRWKYRTPSLRNISLTAPYMHDGSLSNLAEVVSFYNKGGYDNIDRSPLIKPLGLSTSEKGELVEFLKTLTGDNISELISDAFSIPIGDFKKIH